MARTPSNLFPHVKIEEGEGWMIVAILRVEFHVRFLFLFSV
jgi:hypothetical protein